MTPPALNRGDVALVLFPHSDLRTAKTRPALVVQADALGTDLSQVVVAMITSRTFRAGHPSRVFVAYDSPRGRASGLLTDSVVMADNLATISEAAPSAVLSARFLWPASTKPCATRWGCKRTFRRS